MKKRDLSIIANIIGLAGYILLITVNWKIALGVHLITLLITLKNVINITYEK